MSTHILYRVAGDLAPFVNAELVGTDISGWTIKLLGKYRGTFEDISIDHTVDDAASGLFHFEWGADDLREGLADLEIDFLPTTGRRFTVPAENTLLLQVRGKTAAGKGVVAGGETIRIDEDGRTIRIDGGGSVGAGIASAEALLSGLSGASATAAALIPAGAIPVGISTKVETEITGATGYDVGDGSDVDRWGAAIGVAVDSSSGNEDWTDQTIANLPTAGDVVLTAVGGSFTAGAVRVRAEYLLPAGL
jgi:hypothetical protein